MNYKKDVSQDEIDRYERRKNYVPDRKRRTVAQDPFRKTISKNPYEAIDFDKQIEQIVERKSIRHSQIDIVD